MGSWKLGYPVSLRNASSEEVGKAAYNSWSINTLVLSSVEPKRLGSSVTSASGSDVSIQDSMVTDAWIGGWCKFRSGSYTGEVFRIVDNNTNTLTLRKFDGSSISFSGINGNYLEICTGPATYTFPTNRNPYKEDISISTEANMVRFPYYEGGIYIPTGTVEDMVVNAYLTSREEFEKLAMLCKWKSDYTGGDSMATHNESAPMILECGTHDADHQYLVYCTECKKVREGSGGGLIEVQLYLQQIVIPTYRSW